jgi:hypothetical protein
MHANRNFYRSQSCGALITRPWFAIFHLPRSDCSRHFQSGLLVMPAECYLGESGKPDILTQLIFKRFEANRAHKPNVATRGYFVKRYPWMAFSVKPYSFPRFSPYRLSKPHPGASAVLVDEACAPALCKWRLPRLRSFSHPPDVSCSERTLW